MDKNILLEQAEEKYEQSKANYESINIKVHDLKHQIRNFETEKPMNNFISILVENYFVDPAVFSANNLPMTTKVNKENHGYGLKSIKMIVDKYDGSLTVQTKDDIFSLSVLFQCAYSIKDDEK